MSPSKRGRSFRGSGIWRSFGLLSGDLGGRGGWGFFRLGRDSLHVVGVRRDWVGVRVLHQVFRELSVHIDKIPEMKGTTSVWRARVDLP